MLSLSSAKQAALAAKHEDRGGRRSLERDQGADAVTQRHQAGVSARIFPRFPYCIAESELAPYI
jgi:hypothetical protein